MGHKKGGKRERENGRKKDRKGKGTERKAVVSELWGQGYIVPPSSGLVPPVSPKSKMRLMSKF